MGKILKVLLITNLFPNNKEPNKGIFVKQQVNRIAELCELQVVAPIPWFPFNLRILPKWSIYTQIVLQEKVDGIITYHPRWIAIPKIFSSFNGILFFLSIFPKILQIKKRFRFDIIDAQWVYPDGFAAVLFAKILKKPVILHALGCDINHYTKYLLLRKMIKWCLNNANKIIAVSSALKKKIIYLGILPSKIKVIPNGINTNLFKIIDQQNCRSKLGFSVNEKIVIFVGRLEKEKGVEYLLNAFYKLCKEYEEQLHLVIIGKGSLEGKVKKKINILDLGNLVVFPGEIPHKELPLWINVCDVFCLPSIREGMPNVALEALACGKPVVATRVGGIPEVITSEKFGILVPPQDSNALLEAIHKALRKKWNSEILRTRVLGNNWGENGKKVFYELQLTVNKNSEKRN